MCCGFSNQSCILELKSCVIISLHVFGNLLRMSQIIIATLLVQPFNLLRSLCLLIFKFIIIFHFVFFLTSLLYVFLVFLLQLFNCKKPFEWHEDLLGGFPVHESLWQ